MLEDRRTVALEMLGIPDAISRPRKQLSLALDQRRLAQLHAVLNSAAGRSYGQRIETVEKTLNCRKDVGLSIPA